MIFLYQYNAFIKNYYLKKETPMCRVVSTIWCFNMAWDLQTLKQQTRSKQNSKCLEKLNKIQACHETHACIQCSNEDAKVLANHYVHFQTSIWINGQSKHMPLKFLN